EPEITVELGEQCSAQQFAGGVVMAFLQSPAELEGILAIAVSRSACHRQQLIGHLSHGADNNDRLLRGVGLHDGGRALNCFGILDRGAAEFHDDHRWEVLRRRVDGMSVDKCIEGLVAINALLQIALSFQDRKSTRLNSSHVSISYAVFCLKKKK